MARWSYDEPKWIESVLKYYYEAKSGVYFEHSRATKNEATEWIGFLIEFILKTIYHWKKDTNTCLKITNGFITA